MSATRWDAPTLRNDPERTCTSPFAGAGIAALGGTATPDAARPSPKGPGRCLSARVWPLPFRAHDRNGHAAHWLRPSSPGTPGRGDPANPPVPKHPAGTCPSSEIVWANVPRGCRDPRGARAPADPLMAPSAGCGLPVTRSPSRVRLATALPQRRTVWPAPERSACCALAPLRIGGGPRLARPDADDQ